MKKLQILLPMAAVLLSLTGCKKDNEKSGPSGETVTLSATLGGGEKTEIDGLNMKWSEGDKVNINGKSYTAQFPLNDGTYTKASFVGVERAEDGKYYAYYPASIYRSNIEGELPSTQTYHPENGNKLSDISPMYAVTETTELQFHNICALVKLKVTGTGTVKQIVVTSSSHNLWGTFTVSENEGKYYADISEGERSVTLDCGEDGVTLDPETPKTFYIALPQGDAIKDLTFKCSGDAGVWTSQPIATANLTAGKLYAKSMSDVVVVSTPGALSGEFTINASGNKVYFSQGNLQYHTTNKIWRFAENQYDMLDNNINVHTTSDYADNSNKWIDLFGWGTSGYAPSGDATYVHYQPWSTDKSETGHDNNKYGYGPAYNADPNYLTGKSDWGYNAISNGGNRENAGWRTLTKDEWLYLFNTRGGTDAIRYAKATVNGVAGVILVPDNWNTSTYDLQSTNTTGAVFTVNTIDKTDWENILEPAGCVFFPATGYRSGTSVYYVGSLGGYWSSTPNDAACGHHLGLGGNYVRPADYDSRVGGFSVRLVLPVEN